jgi:uncharacterized phiE125 gp8 family phage protein
MQLVIVTPPADYPVSLLEICTHLSVDYDDIDSDGVIELDSDTGTMLESIIAAGTDAVEDITSRKLFTQTWKYFIDCFPCTNFIKIPFGNLQSVTHVKYKDSTGTSTTMTVNTDYIVETNGDQCGRIVLPYATTWPSFTAYPSNPIEIQFVCGWDDTDEIPQKIKSAIKLICGDLYGNREGQVLSGQDYRKNNTVINLLNSSIIRDTFL